MSEDDSIFKRHGWYSQDVFTENMYHDQHADGASPDGGFDARGSHCDGQEGVGSAASRKSENDTRGRNRVLVNQRDIGVMATRFRIGPDCGTIEVLRPSVHTGKLCRPAKTATGLALSVI